MNDMCVTYDTPMPTLEEVYDAIQYRVKSADMSDEYGYILVRLKGDTYGTIAINPGSKENAILPHISLDTPTSSSAFSCIAELNGWLRCWRHCHAGM